MPKGGKISPATEFKPGKSGNPNGRPKKIPELDKLLADVLGEEKDGVTAACAILITLRNKAIRGDVRAAEVIMNRAYGKPNQSIDLDITDTRKATADLFPEDLTPKAE